MTHFSIDVILDVVCVIIKGEVLWLQSQQGKRKLQEKSQSKNQASTSLNSEILILVMFAVCVLMLLSNFWSHRDCRQCDLFCTLWFFRSDGIYSAVSLIWRGCFWNFE